MKKLNMHLKLLQKLSQIINKYNNSDQESKMCGNLWSLKQKIKEDCFKSLRKCEINNCDICLLDNWGNYEKYMSKWLSIDFIHSWRITPLLYWCFHFFFFFHCIQKKLIIPLQHWCFHCCCFFIVFRRNYSSVLDAHPPHPTPAPSHPCFFKLKIVNLFQTCQCTDTFVKYSLLLPFFLNKKKSIQRGQHQYHILGFQNKPSLEDTGVPAYM